MILPLLAGSCAWAVTESASESTMDGTLAILFMSPPRTALKLRNHALRHNLELVLVCRKCISKNGYVVRTLCVVVCNHSVAVDTGMVRLPERIVLRQHEHGHGIPVAVGNLLDHNTRLCISNRTAIRD